MATMNRPAVLMADDDAEDCHIADLALEASGTNASFSCIEDGEKLINYLHSSPKELPAFILLDLNMPRKDGRQALIEIKSEPALKSIPIIVLTTSKEERDFAFSMKAGADCFITKPDTFDQWVKIMKILAESWLGGR
jgi:CheY-like chemotaxis protein